MSGAPVRLEDDSYEHFARVYDAAGFDRFSVGLEGRLLAHFPDGTRPRVADLACGTGSLAARLAPRASRIVGVDASPAMIRCAAAKAGGVRFVTGSLLALPLRGPFDVILCLYDSLNYLREPRALVAAFQEARRIAAPDATFLFDLNDRDAYESIWGSPEPFVGETPLGRVTIRSTWDAVDGIGEAEVVVDVIEAGEARAYVSFHRQRYHPLSDVERALAAAGWETIRRRAVEPFPGDDVLPGGKTLWAARPRRSP